MFEVINQGPPPANLAAPVNSPATYFDKAAGVMYTLSNLGWTPVLESAQDSMTAHAGGGQGSATPITTQNARFTVVATLGDSSVLPLLIPGLIISVANAGAASMNVFPAVGQNMNGVANASFAVAAGKNAIFVGYASTWHSLLSA